MTGDDIARIVAKLEAMLGRPPTYDEVIDYFKWSGTEGDFVAIAKQAEPGLQIISRGHGFETIFTVAAPAT